MARVTVEQLLDIPPDERVKLAQDLWDSVAQNPSEVPVTNEQRGELDRRLESFEKDPAAGTSWEAIKRSLRGK